MANVTRRTAVLTGGAVLIGLSGAGLLARRMVMMEEEAPAPVFTRDGLAIRGIDPVAYFTEGAPVPGDPAHALDWNGATWRFASAENRARFDAAPERHAPRYGGFCAWAVAVKGELYSTQPENFTIFEGRLYLNYNDDIQARWEADIPRFIAAADQRWPEIRATT